MIRENLCIGQSGGPTAAINASLCGIIEGAIESGFSGKIYGMVNGIEGLIKEKLTDLKEEFADKEKREALCHTPSAYLGSCRYKMPSSKDKPEIYERIFDVLKKFGIKYFVYIGGNDSMDTAFHLSEYSKEHNLGVCVIGVPKSIDNDLGGTDHCPGYGSAAKFVASSVREMHCDTNVYDIKSVLIVEVMGRDAGWLTASSVLAMGEGFTSPDLIYLPEVPFDTERFLCDVKAVTDRKNTAIVAVSEGIRDKNGVYICESMSSGAVDCFGHKYLSGAGKVLENTVREKLKIKARAVELNVLQRCAGHIQSACDISEARENGKQAFSAVYSGLTGKMMGYVRHTDENGEYFVTTEAMEIKDIANKEKKIPREWINEEGNFVNDEFIKYVSPLVKGESYPEYKDGIPVYLSLKK